LFWGVPKGYLRKRLQAFSYTVLIFKLLPEAETFPKVSERPLIAIAAEGMVVAAAAVGGAVWVLEGDTLDERYSLETGQGQVWALAIAEDSLMTGGANGLIRRWDLATGAALGEGDAAAEEAFDDGSRGAEVWRACAICHSLTPGSEDRAGPSLHGVFGRAIASLTDFDYSPALEEMDIVWTPETVAELFEHGPEAYTPGSRMPEQRLPNPEDRAALVEFLERMAH
jgi:cytochrome c